MAGKSRGRGRSQFTFSVDTLGFGRPMQFRPVPLPTGEEVDYMLALKQELRASSKNLPFHIIAARKKTDVARYSDKYQNGERRTTQLNGVQTGADYQKSFVLKYGNPEKTSIVIGAKSQLQRKPKVAAGNEEALQKLETLEKREEEQHSDEEEDEEKKKQNNEEQEPDVDEDYDEEDLEDETDYIVSYFDNGEDFGGDSDDNMDEAVY